LNAHLSKFEQKWKAKKINSTDGYVLRIAHEDLVNQVFSLGKYYSGIQRNFIRGTPLLFAAKSKDGDSIVGYGVVDKVEYLWEMTPEEEEYAKEYNWKIGLTLMGATRFRTPLLIKNSLLKDDKRKGAYLHGAKFSEDTINALLEQAEEIQETA
jgi:hypothetical protein